MDSSTETSSDESQAPPSSKKAYVCTYEGCDRSFSKNSKLLYHIRRHTGERPFACTEPGCNKTYLYSFHLRRHKDTFHNPIPAQPRLQCPHEGCFLELANKYSLKKHIKRKHDPEREYPFICKECNKGFHRKRLLLHHSYEHTGVYPFKCETCGNCFPTVSARSRHKRTHTRYPCKCGEAFERWSNLLKHKKACEAVKPKCDRCGKTFATASNLKYHTKHVCENNETLLCGYDGCNRTYLHKSNLVWHINKVHKKIALPRVKCTEPDCEKEFSKKQNLQHHVKLQHSNNSEKVKKPRRPRKDKGIMKTSMAALLAGLNMNYKVQTITDSNKSENEGIVERASKIIAEIKDRANETFTNCGRESSPSLSDSGSNKNVEIVC